MVARQAGVIAGLPLAVATFQKLSPEVRIEPHVRDGASVEKGKKVMTIAGPARAVLTGERTALNFVGRLSGVATLTADYVRHTAGTRHAHLLHAENHARSAGAGEICDPLRRRLQPSLRARRCDPDQGQSHRGRRRRPAVLERARASTGHLVKVEIEVDTLDQLREVLDTGLADVVLLDNMDIATLKRGGETRRRPRRAGGFGRPHLRFDCRDRGDRRRLRLVRRADAFGSEFRRRAGYRGMTVATGLSAL